jgi:hypothetical protein
LSVAVGAGVEAAVLFVAAFTLLAASLALLRLVPWREE